MFVQCSKQTHTQSSKLEIRVKVKGYSILLDWCIHLVYYRIPVYPVGWVYRIYTRVGTKDG